MAMTAGTVTIAANGTESANSGLSGAIYDKLKATAQGKYLLAGESFPSGSKAVPILSGLADLANDLGEAIVDYVTTNAEAVITTGDAGLQRTPNPNNANTATVAPSTEKTLGIR